MSNGIRIVSVNTGPVALLGTPADGPVYSAVRKHTVDDQVVALVRNGIKGDRQPEGRTGKRVPVDPLAAVYAYPITYYPAWGRVLRRALRPGALGENLTVDGILEQDVRIGQRWLWGNTILEVTGPGLPNDELDLLYGADVTGAMRRSGFCGWHMTVVRGGSVSVSSVVTAVSGAPDSPTIADAFRRYLAANSSGRP